MAERTAPKQRGPGRPFKPGQSGNPKGRPRGSRNKLGNHFFAALAEDFENYGVATIRKVREAESSTYIRVLAGLVPKDSDDATDRDSMTDEQLDARIRELLAATGYDKVTH